MDWNELVLVLCTRVMIILYSTYCFLLSIQPVCSIHNITFPRPSALSSTPAVVGSSIEISFELGFCRLPEAYIAPGTVRVFIIAHKIKYKRIETAGSEPVIA